MRTWFLLSLLMTFRPTAFAGEAAPPCPASSRAFLGTPIDAPFFVFDGEGHGEGLGEYSSPSSIALLEEGFRTLLAVSDSGNHRIKVMTTEGFFQDFWGGAGSAAGALSDPRGLAVSPEGDLWVADAGNRRLQLLLAHRSEIGAPTGLPLAAASPRAGKSGAERGFLLPAALAADARGSLYVADAERHAIHKLDTRGRRLRIVATWGGEGSATGRFRGPSALALGGDGNLYVADTGNHRIQKLSPAGRVLAVWGSRGSGPGELESPAGLAFDAAGNLYVAEGGNHRIQKLDRSGRPLGVAGCRGSGPGQLENPAGLAIDREGYLYVADAGNHRLQKLGPQ